MRAIDIPEIFQLSTPEKILLLEDLWESIISDDSEVPVPESHKEQLDRRLERYINSPGELLSLEQLQVRIKRRK
jgi:putative addiction module component (TIGR02574 family)